MIGNLTAVEKWGLKLVAPIFLLYFFRQIRCDSWDFQYGLIVGYKFNDLWAFCCEDLITILFSLFTFLVVPSHISRMLLWLFSVALIYDLVTPFMRPAFTGNPFTLRIGEIVVDVVGYFITKKRK